MTSTSSRTSTATRSSYCYAWTPRALTWGTPKVNRQDRDFLASWARAHGQGRVFYTMLGDWEETWKDLRYRMHLIEGIRWTMGLEGGK